MKTTANFVTKKKLRNEISLASHQELQEYRKLFSSKFKFTNFSIESSSFFNQTNVSINDVTSNGFFQHNTNSAFSFDLFGVTFKSQFIYKNSIPELLSTPSNFWFKLNFDIEKYRQRQKELLQKMNPLSVSKFSSEIADINKSFSRKLLSKFKDSVEIGLKNKFDSLSKNIDIVQFDGKSTSEIGNTLFAENFEKSKKQLQEKLDKIAELQMDSTKKDSAINELKKKMDETEKKIAYLNEIVELIKKEKIAGRIEQIKELNKLAIDEYNTILKNPDQLSKKIASKFKFKGLEKFFSSLSKFRLGGQELPFNTNGNIPNLAKGLSFEINVGNGHLEFSTGQIIPVYNNFSSLNTATNLPSLSSVSNSKPKYWYVNYRKGNLSTNHKGIKLANIYSSQSNNLQLYETNFSEKKLVQITLYAKERLFDNNWFNIEISKSISDYKNNNSLDNGNSKINNDLLNLNNSLVKLKVDGIYDRQGIYYEGYFNKSIGAFNNTFSNNASLTGFEAGGFIKIKPSNAKLSGLLKAKIKDFDIPAAVNSKWTNVDLTARLTYKLKKGQFVQISPSFHSGLKNYFTNNIPRAINQKAIGITSEINLVNKRILGLYNTSFISLGYQHNVFPLQDSLNNNSIVSNSSNIAINQVFLYGNTTFLANLSFTNISQGYDALLYNSQLDIDAGGIFKLSKKMSLGASLVYGYLKGGYTNIGMKYSLSGFLSQNCIIDFNTDVRKNLKIINPFFDQFINFNCSLKYNLK